MGTLMAMFAAIRRGKLKPGMAAEFAKRVQAGALPVMKKMDGFKAYYLIAGGDDTVIAVSVFTNKAVAEGSTQQLMPWIKRISGRCWLRRPNRSRAKSSSAMWFEI